MSGVKTDFFLNMCAFFYCFVNIYDNVKVSKWNWDTHLRIWSSSFECCSSSESLLHLSSAFRSNCSVLSCKESCREAKKDKNEMLERSQTKTKEQINYVNFISKYRKNLWNKYHWICPTVGVRLNPFLMGPSLSPKGLMIKQHKTTKKYMHNYRWCGNATRRIRFTCTSTLGLKLKCRNHTCIPVLHPLLLSLYRFFFSNIYSELKTKTNMSINNLCQAFFFLSFTRLQFLQL